MKLKMFAHLPNGQTYEMKIRDNYSGSAESLSKEWFSSDKDCMSYRFQTANGGYIVLWGDTYKNTVFEFIDI